jgi:hypothetical protein
VRGEESFVTIDDVGHEAMNAILMYIYTAEIDGLLAPNPMAAAYGIHVDEGEACLRLIQAAEKVSRQKLTSLFIYLKDAFLNYQFPLYITFVGL